MRTSPAPRVRDYASRTRQEPSEETDDEDPRTSRHAGDAPLDGGEPPCDRGARAELSEGHRDRGRLDLRCGRSVLHLVRPDPVGARQAAVADDGVGGDDGDDAAARERHLDGGHGAPARAAAARPGHRPRSVPARGRDPGDGGRAAPGARAAELVGSLGYGDARVASGAGDDRGRGSKWTAAERTTLPGAQGRVPASPSLPWVRPQKKPMPAGASMGKNPNHSIESRQYASATFSASFLGRSISS